MSLATHNAQPDILVIGGGVIGTSVARALKRRYTDASVWVLDKEQSGHAHGSGRNSGVLHAGFYYHAESHKAAFTREGNRRLTEYCLERGLAINRCGKLVVTRSAADLDQLDELKRRGDANGVPLEVLSAAEAKAIEPRAKTVERALYSPSTASVDPASVVDAMQADARAEGVQWRSGVSYLGRQGDAVLTSAGAMTPGYVVNTAGLYADRIARDFGFSEHYRILPFKGLYLYADTDEPPLACHLYPVPDLANPFLGVHFTLTVEGRTKLGPTATPAFWREQYRGLDNFSWSELGEILMRQAGLFIGSEFDFKRLAVRELRKLQRGHLLQLSEALIEDLDAARYPTWGKPGIRAQLLDTRTKRLVMDFVFEGDARSFHVLNAVSPGFTCSLPFADHVCDRIADLWR